VTPESWQPYAGAAGNALWWIGKAPTGADSRPVILAIRFEDIRKSVGSGKDEMLSTDASLSKKCCFFASRI
jgi:hypothetical protein